jgi:hypothetical protein
LTEDGFEPEERRHDPGTVLVRDIDPTDVTVPSYFQAIGDVLYHGPQPELGYESRSDGNFAEGTAIAHNLNLVRRATPESPRTWAYAFFYADDAASATSVGPETATRRPRRRRRA